MGLYILCHHSTCLVALGKVYDGASSIHNVPYLDDVVKVSVEKVYNGNAHDVYQKPLELLWDSECRSILLNNI